MNAPNFTHYRHILNNTQPIDQPRSYKENESEKKSIFSTTTTHWYWVVRDIAHHDITTVFLLSITVLTVQYQVRRMNLYSYTEVASRRPFNYSRAVQSDGWFQFNKLMLFSKFNLNFFFNCLVLLLLSLPNMFGHTISHIFFM